MKNELIRRFQLNRAGRDFAVGDIHGMYSLLEKKLAQIEFDPACDRLFSVGDLVNRGPESTRVLAFLSQPWFHAIKGNHEDIVLRAETGAEYQDILRRLKAFWLNELPAPKRHRVREAFRRLPFAFELETKAGLIGMVHAECPFDSWQEMKQALFNPAANARLQEKLMWARRRFAALDSTRIEGVDALVVGHNIVEEMMVLGNTYYIDTGAFLQYGQHDLTLLDLHTLTPV